MVRKASSNSAFLRARRSLRRSISSRSKFVSFAGKNSPNRSRTSAPSRDSIRRKRWNAFYLNGRAVYNDRIFHPSCTLLCEVTFTSCDDMPVKFWGKSSSTNNTREAHAEIKALTKIVDMEEILGEACNVHLLLSYSPCASCADAIITFKQARDLLEILVTFSAVYQHLDEKHQLGLQRLNANPGITLRVFNETDWWRLANETDMPFYYDAKRNGEDNYWKDILKKILRGYGFSLQEQPRHLPTTPKPYQASQSIIHAENSTPHTTAPQLPRSIYPIQAVPESRILHSSGQLENPVFPTQSPSVIHSRDPVHRFKSFQTHHSVKPNPPVIPSDAYQSPNVIHSSQMVDLTRTSQQSQPVDPNHSTIPSNGYRAFIATPSGDPGHFPSTSQSSDAIQPNHPVIPTSRSKPPSVSHSSQVAHPSRPTQLSLPLDPKRPIISSSTPPLIDIMEPRDTVDPFSEFHPHQAVNPRYADLPPSASFHNPQVPDSVSSRSFYQTCPSISSCILCICPEDIENDPTSGRRGCERLMHSKRFAFFIIAIFFLVLPAVILAVTL